MTLNTLFKVNINTEKEEATRDYNPFCVNSLFQVQWEEFKERNKEVLRSVEIKEVEKMLSCKDESRGFWTYYCVKCDEYHNVYSGCNSRLCSHCGKRYADKWAEKLVENTFNVPHKHIVLGLPPLLWEELHNHRDAWKILFDTVIKLLKWFYGLTCGIVKPGLILVLHPFGRDVGFKPHIHGIVTKGGFDKQGNFVEWAKFVPFKSLHKKWMWLICEALKEYFPKTAYYSNLFDAIWAKYGREGFVVEICKPTLYNKKELATYIARYVRHPAIADSRIMYFDEKVVAFYYIDHKTKNRKDIAMPVYEFMSALLQHIPERQFKMIRYYGAYARRNKKKYARYLQRSIKSKITDYFDKDNRLLCPKCGTVMKKVCFTRGKPPPDKNTLDGWK